MTALILRSLTKYLPNRVDTAHNWKHVAGLELADRDPMSSDLIDIIIGADLFGMLVLDGVRKGSEHESIAQNTTLGWILSGPIASSPNTGSVSALAHHGVVIETLDCDLRRFWEIEEVPQKAARSPEDHQCEEHFKATHSRTPEGRFHRLEQRLNRNPIIASEYREFLAEYETLGRMTKRPPTEIIKPEQAYYIPHHAVLRDSSTTTRLRVVFNASCRTSNGTSLNDHMLIGPKLQRDLATVLTPKIPTTSALCGNLLLTNQSRITAFSPSPAAAPYLALRVLDQLVEDDGADFPLAVPVLRHQTYVDDCAFGANQILARQTRDQLVELLKKGGFRLRKWASNASALLSDLDPADHGLVTHKVLQDDDHLKVLGILWNPKLDIFQFRVTVPASPGRTKRAILSTIAKFFDPLGWATPVIITAKVFMQRLWSLKCYWDDEIPSQHFDYWLDYHNRLPCLNDISIPRWTTYGSHTLKCALHGFSDASTAAFAAAVYLRTVNVDGSITVSLLVAKSKVAPLKTMSVPRLELSAAVLLAHLMHFARSALQLPELECHCWTDATITLAWLSPPWLHHPPESWPNSCPLLPAEIPLEQRPEPPGCASHTTPDWDLASRYSSWPKLLRITAYLYRCLNRVRRTKNPQSDTAILISEEIQTAKRYWLKIMQSDLFSNEIVALNQKRAVSKSSPLSILNPYMDEDGLIRIRGRLRRAYLPGATKNPIVLHAHPLLVLIIQHHHLRTLHAGSQLTLASLGNEFWILRARATVRSVLYKCLQCTRERAAVPVELMGDLPAVRVNRTVRAFIHTGVDYAGPIAVRTAPGRGHKSQKAYIALFRINASFLGEDYRRPCIRTKEPHFDRELSSAHAAAIRNPNFRSRLASDGTAWHFLPPASPHFGGLWEAGVKSVKHHLKRCIGLHTLTFEEMSTLLCRIEACLNSRPIAPVSDNLDDYHALTPGHFLIGTPLIAPAEPSVLDLSENRLSRWQMVQQMTEGFWRSWSGDYLHTLQQHPKWRVVQRLAKVGQIVLVRNPLAPPSQWELGRITACHPGDDNLTRVVTIKTSHSVYKRPIAKLCFLPVTINSEESKDSVTAGRVSV
ncbi:PREDICTED: uncharacterized protein LOC108766801 [Trachymyrmex cornetzi]|uniref:uncharacterized protein LOC108766801 n=1 Tax=Trachymyrmex cornetzi TaxID=471704 RepID=UPI00084F36A1|nr:PREDICTED: uncharacterized protein LOC108766801 [Trachymyrmex cornetzi]